MRPGSAACWPSPSFPPLAGITGTDYLHSGALAARFRTAVRTADAICAAGGLLAALTITNPRTG